MASVELRGKRAIVTGASSGIGEATVKQLRDAGVRVAGGARRVDAIDADVALELDVTDRASCASFLERALDELGGVDILVNNAGLALGREPFVDSNEEDEHTIIETNISGLVRITRLALPHLEHGGHIVNMGSIAAIWPYEKGTLYCLSKAAVHAFSRALREDLLGKPIRITTLAPGLVETAGFSLVRFRGDEEKARAVYKDVALGGPIHADDVADCIMFALTRPPHVNVDEIVVMALAQSSGARIIRD
ncbi:MAG: SDR family NAD(P)-dependent oxidoreductase [Gaiellaceae bacterium]|jgi:3-hydroxy acid dehydrogenase/malonic semialdehyde reductase